MADAAAKLEWPEGWVEDTSDKKDFAVYREVPEATALVRKYTENPKHFAVNRYSVSDTVTAKDLTPWPGFDMKTGDQIPDPAGTVPYRTARYCWPFKTEPDVPFPGPKVKLSAAMLAEHAAMTANKVMAVRVMLGAVHVRDLTPSATTGLAGVGSALIRLGVGAYIVCGSKSRAKEMEHLGAEIVVENIAADMIQDGVSKRTPAWPADLVAVCHGPLLRFRFFCHNPAEGLKDLQTRWPGYSMVGPLPEDREFEERMVVETKGTAGRIVEDYLVELVDPALVVPVTW